MYAVVDPFSHPGVCDTITVELHNSISPFELEYSLKNIIDVNGSGQFIFPSQVLSKSYYIVIRHRNSITIWSKEPVYFDEHNMYYDFTKL